MLRTRTLAIVVIVLNVCIADGFAQPPVVEIAVPAAPQSSPGDSQRTDRGSARRGAKPRMVLALPKEYEEKDKNHDGQIGLYEWERSKYAEFYKLDKNGDGFLTAQELGAKSMGVMSKRLGGSGVNDKEALPNPGQLASYNQKIGETFTFTVTGMASGSVWGTGTYTTDSNLATAAVHAGILKDGETGLVRVTMVESPSEFTGSTANGVTSQNWGQFAAGYTVR